MKYLVLLLVLLAGVVAASESCALCTMITSSLIDEVKDDKTDATIIAALEKVCSVIPVDSAECKNILDTYGAMMITAIQQDLTPDLVCETIGLC
ncbi:MAG: Saposin-like protein [Linnemannia gamsii]|nr:MAG: Saposin-like protein [Linnemannia gamsii]